MAQFTTFFLRMHTYNDRIVFDPGVGQFVEKKNNNNNNLPTAIGVMSHFNKEEKEKNLTALYFNVKCHITTVQQTTVMS